MDNESLLAMIKHLAQAVINRAKTEGLQSDVIVWGHPYEWALPHLRVIYTHMLQYMYHFISANVVIAVNPARESAVVTFDYERFKVTIAPTPEIPLNQAWIIVTTYYEKTINEDGVEEITPRNNAFIEYKPTMNAPLELVNGKYQYTANINMCFVLVNENLVRVVTFDTPRN